jgi:prolyl-tRNA synthetase
VGPGIIQDWESKGVNIRVEIGAQELRSNTVVVADLVTKTQHANGRMIATRTSVTLDNLVRAMR